MPGGPASVFAALHGMQATGGGRYRRVGATSHGTQATKGDTPRIDVAGQLIEAPVKAPGDGPPVLTDGALQMTGWHDASGVSRIGCPVPIATGTDRRGFQANASSPQPTGQRACADLRRVTIGVVARSSGHVRAGARLRGLLCWLQSRRLSPVVSREGRCRCGMMWCELSARWARADVLAWRLPWSVTDPGSSD